jgi:hypothetical protein
VLSGDRPRSIDDRIIRSAATLTATTRLALAARAAAIDQVAIDQVQRDASLASPSIR